MNVAGKRDFEPTIMAAFGGRLPESETLSQQLWQHLETVAVLQESEVRPGGRSVNTINTQCPL